MFYNVHCHICDNIIDCQNLSLDFDLFNYNVQLSFLQLEISQFALAWISLLYDISCMCKWRVH